MSEIFQIVKWDNLLVNNLYTIKNIQDDSVFTGEFIINNLDFIKGFEDEIQSTKYVNFDESPFNNDIDNWKEYVDDWLISKDLDANNPHISEPLYNLFGQGTATPNDIAETIHHVISFDGGEAFFDFLNDPEFIIDAAHINNNISYNYDIIGVLFKNINENNEIIDYKWFQIIRYEFSKLSSINSNITNTNKKTASSNFLEKTKYFNIPKKTSFYALPVSKIRQGGKQSNKKNKSKNKTKNKTKTKNKKTKNKKNRSRKIKY